jgi:DNA-binding NarL/FixJ family response regulator
VTIIRVVVADRHALVRVGACATLQNIPEFVLVGEASNGSEVLELCERVNPNVLVLAVNTQDIPAVELVERVKERFPTVAVVMLAALREVAGVRGLLAAGATGYVLKEEQPEALIQAIQTVATSGTWFSLPITHHTIEEVREAPREDLLMMLSNQERTILRLIVQGRENQSIAAELCLRPQTVRNYTSRIYSKLGVVSRWEAIVWGQAVGL